jgi:GntR family transcriptional regulator
MDLQINSKSYVPVHVQLAQQIKHLILAGSLEVGDRLPSIRAMAGFSRANRNMVARVFSDLGARGSSKAVGEAGCTCWSRRWTR